jgi:4-hydroxythreonine-4-phosphate dehydrogenase
MDKEVKIKVGISVGDLNGIGLEVIIKTFSDNRIFEFCTPVLFASSKVFSEHKKALNSEIQVQGITSLDAVIHGKLNVMNIWKEEVAIDFGIPSPASGAFALQSLEAATAALKNNEVDVLVTAPISKDNIQSETFAFPGHTEYLESQLDGESLMILMTDSLRLGLVTGHIPVAKVSETITKELIHQKADIMHRTLVQDFGISKPKIAVLGLNPHCGDHGVIGSEDDAVIQPALLELQDQGQLVYGPYAAEGFFGSQNYLKFDGVLAMYHDQGLVAFKSIAFGQGVNFTAGLSHIRTSPDHGTAFEIAGKNQAEAASFAEAMHTALAIFKTRTQYNALAANKLKAKKRN